MLISYYAKKYLCLGLFIFAVNVAFHISLYTFILHYVTIHAFHNIQYMYHFTHDYKHRLHTRMQAIARTYNIPTHTRM